MALEKHYDSEPLATGTHKGANGTLTIYDPGKDFKSCGVVPGLYIENDTDSDSHGIVVSSTEDSVTISRDLVVTGEWAGASGVTPPTGWELYNGEISMSVTTEGLVVVGDGSETRGIRKLISIPVGTRARVAITGRQGAAANVLFFVTRPSGDLYDGFSPLPWLDENMSEHSYLITALDSTLYVYISPTAGSEGVISDVKIEPCYFRNGETYNIYKTATKGLLLSTHHVDRRFGTKVFKRSDLNTHGHLVDDEDIDIDNPGKVFGPGQPER